VNPHPITQSETTNEFRRYENILWGLNEVSFRVAQKSETFARDLNDAFAEFRFSLNLLAVFRFARSRAFDGVDIDRSVWFDMEFSWAGPSKLSFRVRSRNRRRP
jgi:hypothetical protein